MKNTFKYIIASVAALAFSLPVFAAADEPDNWNAIKVNKTATTNSDGSYTLTLDTFVTGEADSRITTTQPTPADIVLLLDTSASMYEPMDNNSVKQTDDNAATVYDNFQSKKKIYYMVDTSDGTWMQITSMSKQGSTIYASCGTYLTSKKLTDDSGHAIANRRRVGEADNKGISRLQAMKDGCVDFINIIAGYTTAEVQNKISIVTFSSNASAITDPLLASNPSYTASNDDLINAILGLEAGGGTQTNRGLTAAKSILDNVKRSSKKSLIFFTDGEPQDSKSTIYNTAASMKPGVTVYSIGAFASASNDIKTFLSKVSSNYDKNGKSTGETKYSVIASSVDDLTSAFQEFAHDSEPDNTGGAGVQLETNDVTVRDIVTPHFVLPEGESAIKLYVVKNTGIDLDKEESDTTRYSWDYANKVEPDASVVKAKTVKGEDGTTIDVTGFDFSANWVGYHVTYKNDKETGRTLNEGYKLQIVITILPDPNAEGGPVPTNDSTSGVYVDGKNQGNAVVNYEVPPTQFTPMDLIIKKSGLKSGDSSIFTITRAGDDDFSLTVVLTSNGSDVSQTLTKLAPNNASGEPYVYTVTETNWAWNYSNSDAVSHSLYTVSNGEYTSTNEFSFTATKADDAPTNNAEAVKKNEFKTRN